MLHRGHSRDGCYRVGTVVMYVTEGTQWLWMLQRRHSGDGCCYRGDMVVMDVTEGTQW